MNPFEELIKALGIELGLSLKVDANQACRLEIAPQFHVQIDLASTGDELLIGCNLAPINPGKYREQLLEEALSTNGKTKQPRGILAFSSKTNSLLLFEFLSLAHTTAKYLTNFLTLFISHARIWKEAIMKEQIPEIEEPSSP